MLGGHRDAADDKTQTRDGSRSDGASPHALGAGACLLAGGVATRAARSNGSRARRERGPSEALETIDARLKSVFGISLEDFAALVRDENDMQVAGKELYEKKQQYKRLQQMERGRGKRRRAAALAKAQEEGRARCGIRARRRRHQSDSISDSEPVEAPVESETPVELESSDKAADPIAVLKHTLELPDKDARERG